ncbi:hypothetical protein GCM10023170_064080 [Phytohabitans houttuyneae]|uniref:Uncharacterized protein n=1 Tax=Phytohabitans houttuyneae TaxID=1076126 RepID=A0A6V8KIB0_9ACTN|nr:hypothetical protein Phou_059160 [Phytohabitans houttuyneae]
MTLAEFPDLRCRVRGSGPDGRAWKKPLPALGFLGFSAFDGLPALLEAVLVGLPDDQAPFAQLTAHELAPGQWSTTVEGFPPGEPFMPVDKPEGGEE